MEVLGAVASVASLADISVRVSGGIHSLVSDWINAPAELVALQTEVDDSRIFLIQISYILPQLERLSPSIPLFGNGFSSIATALRLHVERAKPAWQKLENHLKQFDGQDSKKCRFQWLRLNSKINRFRKVIGDSRRHIQEMLVLSSAYQTNVIGLQIISLSNDLRSTSPVSTQRVLIEMQAEAPSREEMLENGPAQLPDALNELAGLQACADAGPSDQSLSSRESQQASDETSLDDSGHPSVSGPSCPDFSKKDSDLSASSRSCYEMDCKCRCHLLVRQSRHGSRGFFKYILGSLVLGYISVSSPTGDCDNPACARRENGLTMTLRYTFPTWVAKRVLTSSVSPWGSGPHIFTFATSRRIFYAPGNIFSRINSRDFGGATQLLQNGSANIRDIEARHGVSILGAALRHPALRPGFVRFIEFLFESGVDPHVSNDRGESPWLLASRLILPRTPAFMASPELKDQLRRLFPRLDWDNLHYTHLHMIISGLRPLDLKEALKVPDHHAQINARDALGETPLGLAAMLGDDEAVEALLLAGADPESGARGAPSPIRRAIQSRNRRCVELLLMRCTNPLVLDARGATLVHAAAAGNNTLNVVEPLLLAGIPTDSLNVHRCTPLSFTPLHDNHMVARYLIDRGANINNIDKDGDTPLTEAVRLNAHNCLRLFIESGADVRILNGRLRNVLHFAAAFGDVETLDILCTAKLEPASIQAGDFAGNTPADLLRMRQIQPEGLIEAFGRLVESLSTSNGGSMRSRSTSSTTT